jgi:hypothetical protein
MQEQRRLYLNAFSKKVLSEPFQGLLQLRLSYLCARSCITILFGIQYLDTCRPVDPSSASFIQKSPGLREQQFCSVEPCSECEGALTFHLVKYWVM